jgi:hypothetical protein
MAAAYGGAAGPLWQSGQVRPSASGSKRPAHPRQIRMTTCRARSGAAAWQSAANWYAMCSAQVSGETAGLCRRGRLTSWFWPETPLAA